jgi:hypothetical protein
VLVKLDVLERSVLELFSPDSIDAFKLGSLIGEHSDKQSQQLQDSLQSENEKAFKDLTNRYRSAFTVFLEAKNALVRQFL